MARMNMFIHDIKDAHIAWGDTLANPQHLDSDTEELIAQYSFKIKEVISDNAKRDWKHNEVVHKAMHRSLDDCLFDMFEEMGVVIDKSNIDMLDLIIDETMKVAVARY